jgi:hypothetical protein
VQVTNDTFAAQVNVSDSPVTGLPGLENGGQGWEFCGAYGFRVDVLDDGEQFHVSMLHVPYGGGNSQGRTHSETSSNCLCTNTG